MTRLGADHIGINFSRESTAAFHLRRCFQKPCRRIPIREFLLRIPTRQSPRVHQRNQETNKSSTATPLLHWHFRVSNKTTRCLATSPWPWLPTLRPIGGPFLRPRWNFSVKPLRWYCLDLTGTETPRSCSTGRRVMCLCCRWCSYTRTSSKEFECEDSGGMGRRRARVPNRSFESMGCRLRCLGSSQQWRHLLK